MDKKLLDIDSLYLYSYCPYYFKNYKPSRQITNDLITAMLSRILVEKAESCFIGTRKIRAIYRLSKKYYELDVKSDKSINDTFKEMTKIIGRLRFSSASIINGLGIINNVEIPIHAILKTTRNEKDFYHHIHYYFSLEEPSELRINNDIRILSAALYAQQNYSPCITDIQWRNKVYRLGKRKLDSTKIESEIDNLTHGIKNDIIYKRIGKWCERCSLRSICAKGL